ncbi:putative esterase/lipase [Phyllosticta citriasiana]|uniref:Esterase/lipase n=1 Tax=Phyllosticta citriasiana TaxID=595635 RepID=A0ABR1KYZ1_9PEZI
MGLKSFFKYLRLKILVTLIRLGIKLKPKRKITVDKVLQIPSRDAKRTIKAHVYQSQSPSPTPVLVNFHGSGFCLPLHGSDNVFCQEVRDQTNYTVIDVQYRLAPENPFPAALNDVEDAVKWVLEQPEAFKRDNVAISGFSAGGTLALATASSVFPKDTFRSLLTFYSPTNLAMMPEGKAAPDPTGTPLPARLCNIFEDSYIPEGFDKRDPRISPLFAPPDNFPRNVMIVTCAQDSLAHEAEELAKKIENEPGHFVLRRRYDGVGHGWDKKAEEGTPGGESVEMAHALALDLLRR